MLKYVLLAITICVNFASLIAKDTKEPILTESMIQDVDGVAGFIDKRKIGNMIWLMQEIRHLHAGHYRVNAKGEPDPSRGTTVKDLMFKGKLHTIKQLVDLETQNKFTAEEKSEFNALFATVKEYFDRVTKILAPEAAGTHPFMHKLTEEFCRKKHRSDSLLLDWHKGDEVELYRRSVISFKIFNIFSTDLMNFLGALVMSCPKAYASYKKSTTGEPALQQ